MEIIALLVALVSTITIVGFGFRLYRVLRLKNQMNRNENELKREGVLPYGACVQEGIARKEGKRKLLNQSQPSPMWYVRLSESD